MLGDIFENFQNKPIGISNLDPAYLFSLQGFIFEAALTN